MASVIFDYEIQESISYHRIHRQASYLSSASQIMIPLDDLLNIDTIVVFCNDNHYKY